MPTRTRIIVNMFSFSQLRTRFLFFHETDCCKTTLEKSTARHTTNPIAEKNKHRMGSGGASTTGKMWSAHLTRTNCGDSENRKIHNAKKTLLDITTASMYLDCLEEKRMILLRLGGSMIFVDCVDILFFWWRKVADEERYTKQHANS